MNLFFYKLILMTIALMPNTDGVHEFEIIHHKSAKPMIATIDRKAGKFEVEGIHYTVDTGKEKFEIHLIDNGLYRLKVKNKKPFEIDMIPYFIELDYGTKTGHVQSLGKPPIQVVKTKEGYRIFSAGSMAIIDFRRG